MILKKVSFDHKSNLEFVEKLYIESFPRNERRPVLEMHHLMEKDDRYNVFLLVNEEDDRIGFITYWMFDSFLFLEHFAISPDHRNGGYGQLSIDALKEQTSLPLLAEIELPSTSEFASRRADFYLRQGFHIWDIPYEQPPYEKDCEAIPMLLLTYRDLNLKNEAESIINHLYTHVYKRK